MPSTTTDRIDGLTTSVAIKPPCVVASIANVPLAGTQTVNGVAVAAGDRVLVMAQTDDTENGIYICRSSAWERARDFDGARDAVTGTLVPVVSASGTNAVYRVTTTDSPVVFGTSSITFSAALFGDSATLNFIQAGTGAVSRGAQEKMRDFVSVFDFMTSVQVADVQSATLGQDVTTAMQTAITYCESVGADLYLPAGSYLVSGTLTIAKSMRIEGAGWRTNIVVKTTVGATTDIIKISPSTSAGDLNAGFDLENFKISSQGGTPGRHAIAIDITTRPAYHIHLRGLFLAALGGRGIASLPHASPLTDGYFTSTIEECTIYNGIYLDKAGDSIRIARNTITGANVGIYADLIYGASDGGAHGLAITENNITSNGGALLVKNAWGGSFTFNNVECPNPSGIANNATIDIDGSAGTIVNGFNIAFNFLSAFPGCDVVRLNYTRACRVISNYHAEPGGGGYSFRVTANGASNQILYNTPSGDSAMATQFTDAGSLTCFLRHGLSGFHELTRDLFLIKAEGKLRGVDSAGTSIPILSLSAIDDTVKLGTLTAAASNGYLVMHVQGVEVARLTPARLTVTGNLTMASATVASTVGAAGAGSALPATPAGYWSVIINGTTQKIPYYAN